MSYKIPLYNCYWCRCGYCLNHTECLDHCIKCINIRNNYNRYYIPQYCENFIENHISNRRIKDRLFECETCYYKKELEKIKKSLEILMKG